MIRLILAFIALAAATGLANAQSDLVKRGDYLVNSVLTCGNCHTPKGPTGDIMDKAFSGGLSWDEPPFKVTAPNITQDKETGIGKWSAADITQAACAPASARTARRSPPSCRPASTRSSPRSDMDAIVAYLRTLKPIKNKVPDPIYKMPQVRADLSGRRDGATPKPMFSDQRQARLLSRHHRALHGMPHADGQGPAPDSRPGSAPAASNSPAPGACRPRATSPRARARASAPGPTPRSRRPSPRHATRTATTSSRRWASILRQHDRRRLQRHHRLSAHGAGEGVKLSSPGRREAARPGDPDQVGTASLSGMAGS